MPGSFPLLNNTDRILENKYKFLKIFTTSYLFVEPEQVLNMMNFRNTFVNAGRNNAANFSSIVANVMYFLKKYKECHRTIPHKRKNKNNS